MSDEMEEFGKLLVQFVRDHAIRDCDIILRSEKNTPIKKRWHEAEAEGGIEYLSKVMIADCIDQAIFSLLYSIDQGELKLSFDTDSGKKIVLNESGELAGWYIGNEWRGKYSKERFFEDFPDED